MMTAKIHHKRLVYFYLMVYKICTTLIKEKTSLHSAMSDDKDDKDDEYDSGIFTNWDAQNLHHINQRKGHRFTQT